MRTDRRCPHGQAGFSLLEILVAFAVLALTLGVLLRIFGGAGRIAATADEYSRSIVVAESLLATVGIETPLQPGETHGEIDETYRWTLQVDPYPMDESLLGGASLAFRPYWVRLSVEWGDPDDPRAFDLATLRLLQDSPRGAVR
jgi:general secretion pathway protein I